MPLRLNGATSGYVQLSAPSVAGSASLELPTDSIKPALVLINSTAFTSATSVSIDNCFSSAYENYRILIHAVGSAGTEMFARFRASGTDNTTAAYVYQNIVASGTSLSASQATGDTKFRFGTFRTSYGSYSLEVFSPFVSSQTTHVTSLGNDQDGLNLDIRATAFQNTVSFDGITVYPNTGTGTGVIRVYGYRNSL